MDEEQSAVDEQAGKVLEYIIKELIPEKRNLDFLNSMTQILTLCVSSYIKCTFCKSHWDKGYESFEKIIKQDLELVQENE